MNVRWPDINFTISEISTDPATLAKTYRITNYGDRITDLKVYADDNICSSIIFYPTINHGNLGTGQSIEFETIPTLSEYFIPIGGHVVVHGLNTTIQIAANFSIPPGKQVFLAQLENPLLCISMRDWYCSNRPDISIPFNIPSGYEVDEAYDATLYIDFEPRSNVRPHNVYLSVNGHPIGEFINTIPRGRYAFNFDASYIHGADEGVSRNVINLKSTQHKAHYVVTTNMKVCVCLRRYEGYVVAASQDVANELLWNMSYLTRTSSILDVDIVSPSDGDSIIAGTPALIKARVTDDGTNNIYPVIATFSCEGGHVWLYDDGLHGDDAAGDGVYANEWTPMATGDCTIMVRTSNCGVSAEDSVSAVSYTHLTLPTKA